MDGGRGGRKDGGREGGARTEPALFRREHRAQAPAEREEERPENKIWVGRGGEQAGRDREGESKRERETERESDKGKDKREINTDMERGMQREGKSDQEADRHMEGTSETEKIRLRETEINYR